MGSISKCQKLYKEQDDKQSKDRISNLPSCVIGRILSLLPTKYAVATSVLSTRWKQLWVLITSLDFDDKLLIHHGRSANSVQLSFTNFVYRVLVLRTVSYVHVFRLRCCQTYDVSHVNTWVAASLVCGVQELNLSIQTKEGTGHVLPQDLFTCGTMVKLKIGTSFVLNVPTKVQMWRLKILHLDGVEFRDDDSIYRLISGCLVLDELRMKDCVGEDVSVVHISAPVLTKLSIKPLAFSERSMYEVVLECPALLYLELDDDVEWAKGYVVKNLSHLIEVDINICGPWGPFSMEDREIISEIATNILTGISSIQRLCLHGEFIVVLHKCDYQLPTFRNLTSLEMDQAFYLAWDLMMRLVQKSPHLQTIVFSNEPVCECGNDDSWNPPQKVPTCLAVHLKVIEIEDFQGLDEELKMLEYFLKNGEVLEKVVLRNEGIAFLEEDVDVVKKLLRLPRVSKICHIECV